MTGPIVTVVVVTYNSAADVEACLSALPIAARTTSYEVVVVDNASEDGSAELVAASAPRATLVSLRENVGFARACNVAVDRATTEYVLLVNPDAVLHPGCIDVLVQHARQHPEQTPLGGRCVDEDGRLDPRSCWSVPTLWSTFCISSGLARAFPSSSLLDPEGYGGWQRDSVREVGVVTGFLLLVRRADWTRLGGLDERFFVYGEDVDFSIRARAAGLGPTITPTAVVTHEAGRSSTSTEKLVLLHAGKVTLMDKHWGRWRRRVGVGVLSAGVLVRTRVGGRRPEHVELWRRRRSWTHGF